MSYILLDCPQNDWISPKYDGFVLNLTEFFLYMSVFVLNICEFFLISTGFFIYITGFVLNI